MAAIFFFLITLVIVCLQMALALEPPYGKLSVKGTQLLGESGQPVALHGMSLFWSQFPSGAPFYNKATVQTLKCDWNANVVRAAMGVEVVSVEEWWPGYLANPAVEQAKVEAVVDAAIELGIYVIVDWHDHNATLHPDAAVQFFANISAKYGKYPHIIYETYNEPKGGVYKWPEIKAYHEKVVPAIRANDPDNVIVLGTAEWSQDVDIASEDPVNGTNLMYSLHYYAASHKQQLRNKAQVALNNGIGIFVTEYGTVFNTGDGAVDLPSSEAWWTFLDQNNISYASWAIENKKEGSAVLQPNITSLNVPDANLTEAGYLAKMKLKSQNNHVRCVDIPTVKNINAAPKSVAAAAEANKKGLISMKVKEVKKTVKKYAYRSSSSSEVK